ncbi:hypothetical protein BC008_08725 [Mastigocoleus testarum BC008]|uniref:CopG family transcriptional regulator n=1 Tax=Mastigocoleus testarum BC008 TaxID=371196 RepID=A0A0V7ZCK6_9CYAN|nr:hypothetical protein BC008_08725 [Mastigocoleus testarum BC008]
MTQNKSNKNMPGDRHKFKDRIVVRLSSEKKELFKKACQVREVSQSEMFLYWIDKFIDETDFTDEII